MSSVLKKIKQRSENYEKGRKAQKDNKKKTTDRCNVMILAACIVVLICVVLTFYFVLNKKEEPNAMEFYINEGQVTGSASREFLSLCVADINYQLSGLGIEEVDRHTFALENLSILLRAEHLFDNVYNWELTDKQKKSIDEKIEKCIDKYGSEKKFESHLEKYQTNIDALRRYLELNEKQSLVRYSFISGVTQKEMQEYFASNYVVFDAVAIPVSEDDKTCTEAYALCERIKSGEMTIDDAKAIYGADVRTTFYSSKNNDEKLPASVYDKIWGMRSGEIDIAQTSTECYILQKMDTTAEYLGKNESLGNKIKDVLGERNFALECETMYDYIHVIEDVANRVLPDDSPALNIKALTEN